MKIKFFKLQKLLKFILGLDQGWKKQFDRETSRKIAEMENEWERKGLFNSGLRFSDISHFETQRKQERKDEERKRLLEGLAAIPPWLTLLFSLLALTISLIALFVK